MPSRPSLLLAAAAAAAVLGAAGPAAAQGPFDPSAPVGGFGAQPDLAGISDFALAGDDTGVLAGSASTADRRFPVAAFAAGEALAGAARAVGHAGDITSQPRVAVGAGGRAAIAWGEGHTAYLRLCTDGRCGAALAVGRSRLKPEPQVAMQPGTGRVLVLWRGAARRGAASGRNRLQWRITTTGRLGRTHTLGEFGDDPRIGTDAGGKTVAVWRPYGARSAGVRAAARGVGEFLEPSTITTAAAQDLRLVVSAGGEAIAAWRQPAPGGADVQSPRGTPVVASRTRITRFGTPRAIAGVTDAATLQLALGGPGAAVLVFDRQAGDAPATPTAAFRPGRGQPFGAPVAVGPAAFVATTPGPSAAVDGRGVATVSWGAGRQPGAAAGEGVYAARSTANGVFGAPQLLGTAGPGSAPTLAAAAGDATLVAFTGAGGVRVARAG